MTIGRMKVNGVKERKDRRTRVGKSTCKSGRKGMGKRAQKSIREAPCPAKKQSKAKNVNAGPPLKISGGSSTKQTGSMTPADVVKNIRRR